MSESGGGSSRLAGKRGVVTGAASGLGRAIALEIARRGARVIVADVDRAGADETVEQIRALSGPAAHAVECDVRAVEQVEAVAAFADREIGGVDVIVNNAGVATSGLTGEIPLEDWRFVVDVNLWGVIHGCHVFLPRFRRQGSGFVLNVASAAGLLSPPRMAPYNVTKTAVVALSETLRAEVAGQDVHVTVLCPTFFRTRILDNARGGDPADKARVEKMMDRSRMQAPEVAAFALDALEANRLYAVPMWDGFVLWGVKRLSPAWFPKVFGYAERLLR
jgi:NAD(P)-dependent dehydrogenase (short-subunit alcohol dehydrogenase family)